MTIYPHFAALIAEGVKTIEGRSWARSYRGPLAIHCAGGWGAGGFRACRDYLLSFECPAQVWNELLKARNSNGDPYVEGPEREVLRRAPRGRVLFDGPEGVVHEPAFERGHIVAVATINRIVHTNDLPRDLHASQGPLCDFDALSYAWMLDDLTRIDPVACTGGQQLWNVPPQIADAVYSALNLAGQPA